MTAYRMTEDQSFTATRMRSTLLGRAGNFFRQLLEREVLNRERVAALFIQADGRRRQNFDLLYFFRRALSPCLGGFSVLPVAPQPHRR